MTPLRVLVGCEFSGVVREAFRARGFDAWSCDVLPAEDGSPFHLQMDVREALRQPWDLAIFHPPCTHLAVSGARWFVEKQVEQADALAFVRDLMAAPVPCWAIENPVSIISTRIRRPDQVIQPWQHGHAETKTTCLWLNNLPLLAPSQIVEPDYMRRADGTYYTDAKGKRYSRIHFMSGRKADTVRGRERSRTYRGIAAAMADQWGDAIARQHGQYVAWPGQGA